MLRIAPAVARAGDTLYRWVGVQRFLLLVIPWVVAACTNAVPEEAAGDPPHAWRVLGSWSGSGDAQLGTVHVQEPEFRVRWVAADEKAPGEGALRVSVHSADSGRALREVVRHAGVGSGAVVLSEAAPRNVYLVVESSGVDWSLTLEEAFD